MNRPQKAAALALAITSAWLGVAGADDLTGVYRSSRWRVVMEAPTDYRRAGESPFPGVLARFAHSSGATLTLSATTLPKRRKAVTSPCGDDTLGAFATENVRVILAHGYVLAQEPTLRGKACVVSFAPARDGTGAVRQAYLTSAELGYVVTLALPTGAAQRSDDLDTALGLLQIQAPPAARPRPSQPTPAGGDEPDMVEATRRYPDVKPWYPRPRPQPEMQEPPAP